MLDISVSVSLQTSSRMALSIPRMAAMPPCCSSAAYCMSLPRSLTNRAPSAMLNAPATRAVYSPRLCPAIKAGAGIRSFPNASSMARRQAMLTVMIPGWVLTVLVNSSSGPSKKMRDTAAPRASSTSSKTALAAGELWYSSRPIPTA